MGEAKRIAAARRERIAAGTETTMRDLERGDDFRVRLAGSPTQYLARFRELAALKVAGERSIVIVPCAGCRACCFTQVRVPVDPDIEPTESLRHLGVVRDDDGWRLRKNPDGSCVHVGPEGCSIYPHRPAACRFYDCRVFGLAGIRTKPAVASGACEPTWCFTPETEEDFALLMLVELGSRRFAAEHPDGVSDGEIICAALLFAQRRLKNAAASIAKLRALPAAKRKALAARLLGGLRS